MEKDPYWFWWCRNRAEVFRLFGFEDGGELFDLYRPLYNLWNGLPELEKLKGKSFQSRLVVQA